MQHLDVVDTPGHETVYGLLYRKEWSQLLAFVHRHYHLLEGDPLLDGAVDRFVDEFFRELEAGTRGTFEQELQTLFLLHKAGMYVLPPSRFEGVVERLVVLSDGDAAAALGYARHCPENARCRSVIDALGEALPGPAPHAQDDSIDLSATSPLADEDLTISLFKSNQELSFFMAVREVYASYLVYPNVSLRCVVDYERIRERLWPKERSFFFTALVDCVVFDQHDDYRPRFFFELDSVLHDDETRRHNDRYKAHILALAGQTLHRIRPRAGGAGRSAFVKLLREIAPTA